MATPELTGARIRARRTKAGMAQAALARAAGISPSYLNLIEHGRRPVGGRILSEIARVLEVDATILARGAGGEVLAALGRAVDIAPPAEGDPAPERDAAERFAADYPGWAALLARLEGRVDDLERRVVAMGDRMAHDPVLSASVHDVLSSVTSIRSTAAILVEDALEPEWRARFHRNVHEDARRLADSAQGLAAYLDAGDSIAQDATSPREEAEAWFSARGWCVEEIEAGGEVPEADIAALGPPGRDGLRRSLARYAREARELPRPVLAAALREHGLDPVALADALGRPLATVLRRLAQMPSETLGGPVGLVECDGSGALTFRRPVNGFTIPRYGAACPFWPLFQALMSPRLPVREALRQSGRDARPVVTWTAAETAPARGVAGPLDTRVTMLVVPEETDRDAARAGPPSLGATCRLCALPDCPARREAPLLGEAAFDKSVPPRP